MHDEDKLGLSYPQTDQAEENSLVDNLIDEETAAKLLGRSRQWLRNLRLEGEGPVYVDLGNTVSYYRHDLRVWLESRRKEPHKTQRKSRPKAKKASSPVPPRTAKKAPTTDK